jgi:molybdate/tungstate transport system substrate-binding protein
MMIVSALAAAGLASAGFSMPAHRAAALSSHRVNVVYAGSLALINDQVLGPRFQRVTSILYQGQGGGSFAMAQELKSHLLRAQVFESVGTAPIQELEPKQTTWSVRVSATPLVIAYNPKSPEAAYFKKVADHEVSLKAFFEYLASHKLHLGRTNPRTDPQGQAFYEMVELAVRRYHLPAADVRKILGSWNNTQQIYSEEGLPTELQSGGLDLSSAFLPEVKQDHMPYIALPSWLDFADAHDAAWYAKATINLPTGRVHGVVLAIWATALNHSALGAEFIRFMIRHESLLKSYGYPTLTPAVQGSIADVPPTVPHA